MNPEIKKQWVDALRSGEYLQGQDLLRDANNKFCCLGVLCDFYSKATGVEWGNSFNIGRGLCMHEEYDVLPGRVAEWVGLPLEGGNDWTEVPVCYGSGSTTLASMNDRGDTFAQIADVIEEKL